MSRFNICLLGLAALQLILIFVTRDSPDDQAGSQEGVGQMPFESLKIADLRKVEVTDDDLKNVVLEKQGEGDDQKWVLASKDGYPVKQTEIQRSLDSLNKLRITRLITRKKKNFTSLEVSDSRFARHIVLTGTDGRTLGDIFLGDSARHDTVRYRAADKEIVYEASGISTWDFNADASNWIDTGFTDLESDDVVRLKLTHGEEDFEIAREEIPVKKEAPKKEAEEPKPETRWVVVTPKEKAGQELDKSKVESLLGSLGRLYAAEPVGKLQEGDAYGFGSPTSKAILTMKDGATTEITVGAKREKEDDYYARRSGFDFVVTLRSWSVTGSFQKKLADLIPEKKNEPEDPDKK